MRRFLLLDDEIHVLNALKRALRQQLGPDTAHVEIYDAPAEALARLDEMQFDLVISDLRMPDMDGVAFLTAVRARQPDAVRMLLSASTDFDSLMDAINSAEIFRFIAKPWQIEDLQQTIVEALARRDASLAERMLAAEVRAERGELTADELFAEVVTLDSGVPENGDRQGA